MNREEEMVALLRAVLSLGLGESHVVREEHLPLLTVHRYRDGWHFFTDNISDRVGFPKALLGWSFRDEQDVADFLTTGEMKRYANALLVGERV